MQSSEKSEWDEHVRERMMTREDECIDQRLPFHRSKKWSQNWTHIRLRQCYNIEYFWTINKKILSSNLANGLNVASNTIMKWDCRPYALIVLIFVRTTVESCNDDIIFRTSRNDIIVYSIPPHICSSLLLFQHLSRSLRSLSNLHYSNDDVRGELKALFPIFFDISKH